MPWRPSQVPPGTFLRHMPASPLWVVCTQKSPGIANLSHWVLPEHRGPRLPGLASPEEHAASGHPHCVDPAQDGTVDALSEGTFRLSLETSSSTWGWGPSDLRSGEDLGAHGALKGAWEGRVQGAQCSYEDGPSRVRSHRSSSWGPIPGSSWGCGTRDYWGSR